VHKETVRHFDLPFLQAWGSRLGRLRQLRRYAAAENDGWHEYGEIVAGMAGGEVL
jgi:hypothetical protein